MSMPPFWTLRQAPAPAAASLQGHWRVDGGVRYTHRRSRVGSTGGHGGWTRTMMRTSASARGMRCMACVEWSSRDTAMSSANNCSFISTSAKYCSRGSSLGLEAHALCRASLPQSGTALPTVRQGVFDHRAKTGDTMRFRATPAMPRVSGASMMRLSHGLTTRSQPVINERVDQQTTRGHCSPRGAGSVV